MAGSTNISDAGLVRFPNPLALGRASESENLTNAGPAFEVQSKKIHCYDLNFAMKYFVATKSILLTGKILRLITEVATLANLLCLHYTMIIDMHTLLLLFLARSVLNNNLFKH